MKYYQKLLFHVFFCFILLQSVAQPVPLQYFSITYVKIKPAAKANDYIKLITDYGNPLTQYRSAHSNVKGWNVYQVIMPAGQNNEYDFAIETFANDVQVLLDDTTNMGGVFKKIFPERNDLEMQAVFNKYDTLRTVIKVEVFKALSLTRNSKNPPLYAKVNFMKVLPGMDSAFVSLENNEWMKLHKEGMRLGIMADWELDKKLLPANRNADFDYLSVDFYNTINAMFDARYNNALKTLWPGGEAAKVFKETEASRIFVRSEIWKLVNYAR